MQPGVKQLLTLHALKSGHHVALSSCVCTPPEQGLMDDATASMPLKLDPKGLVAEAPFFAV